MRFKRLWAMFKARNREFFRDRAAFGWNFLFPFLIILGFGVIFKGDYQSTFKVGVFPVPRTMSVTASIDNLPASFTAFKTVTLVGFETQSQGMDTLKHHKIDLLVDRLNHRHRIVLETITSIVGAVVCLIITWFGIIVTWDHLQRGVYTATDLEIPWAPLLAVIPLGTLALSIQFLTRAGGHLKRMKSEPDR